MLNNLMDSYQPNLFPFQELLRSTLAQYQAQFEAMSAVSPIAPHPLPQNQQQQPPTTDKSEQQSSSSAPPDDELVRWLRDLSLSDQTIKQASSTLGNLVFGPDIFDIIN